MECTNSECPYWRKGEACPAAVGCAGYESKEFAKLGLCIAAGIEAALKDKERGYK